MTLGSFASAADLPFIYKCLIDTWDWQFAWRFWGVLLLVVFVPLAIFVRNKPEEMGLQPDGLLGRQDKSVKPGMGAAIKDNVQDWTLKEAMRTKAFWAILICVGIPAMVNTG